MQGRIREDWLTVLLGEEIERVCVVEPKWLDVKILNAGSVYAPINRSRCLCEVIIREPMPSDQTEYMKS